MTRVLIVKTSSLGDVVHTLPAVTDATRALPGIRFDWLVEEALAPIPGWHPAVDRVIPVGLRRWRRRPWQALAGDWKRFRADLGMRRYDLVIDAQGLLKSAALAALAPGPAAGLDAGSAREPLASRFYRHRYPVAWGRHAITRVRDLFAQALGYALPEDGPDYGLERSRFAPGPAAAAYLVFLHGTTWPTKHWPEAYWASLAQIAADRGLAVRLPWGNAGERARAGRIAGAASSAGVLPALDLEGLACELAGALAVVGVDTGLAHLAAALEVPSVTLYGATRADLTGTLGRHQHHLAAAFPCAPCLRRRCRYGGRAQVQPACYAGLPPEAVWRAVATLPGVAR